MKFLVSFLVASFFVGAVQAAPMANELTDLAYFPEQGRVQLNLTGGFDSMKATTGEDTNKTVASTTGMGGELQALYSINNWVAAGIGVQFDAMSMGNQVGEADRTKRFKNMGAAPSLVVAASAMGAESDQPFAINAQVRFAPKWTSFAKPQAITQATSANDELVAIKEVPKAHSLGVDLVASYKAHPMVQVALEGGYTKAFMTKEDKKTTVDRWTYTGNNPLFMPSVMSAALRAQVSVQDKAFVVAGGEFERSSTFTGRIHTDQKDINQTRNDIRVALGVKAPVHESVAVNVGGTYLVSRSEKMSNETAAPGTPTDRPAAKNMNWGVRAGLVALF